MNKKIITLGLSILLIINLFHNGFLKGKSVWAIPMGVYINNNFETFNGKVTEKLSLTDNLGNVCWLYNANENAYFENKSVDEFRGTSLALINSNNNSTGIYISKPSITLKDKFIFEGDLSFSDKSLERKISLKLNSQEQDMYEIVFKKDGTITLSNYTKTYGTNVLRTISKKNYDINKWYNIKFMVDPMENSISICLNNELLDSRVFNTRSWDTVTETRITQAGNSSVSGGEMLVDNFRVYDYVEVEDIKVQDIIVSNNSYVKLHEVVTPEIANTQLIYTSSDEEIVAVDSNGVLNTKDKNGVAIITIKSLYGEVETTCKVTVDNIIQVESINLPSNLEIQKGSTLDLKELVTVTPENATNKNIIWSTSDDRKLKVDSDGVLTGVNWGEVEITAKTQNGNKVDITDVKVRHIINPPLVDSSEYDKIRKKYLYDLTGGNYDYNDKNIRVLVDKIFTEANNYWTSINKDKESRKHLWDDISNEAIESGGYDEKTVDIKKSDAITTSYRRIEAMARAYNMENSPLKGDETLLADIIDALEWMYDNKYNESLNVEYGNWWNWEIGTPTTLTNIGVLLFDELDKDTIKKYMAPIYFYQPDPFNYCFRELNQTNKAYKPTTGANRSDCAKIASVLGILMEDYEQVAMARDAIESLLEYTIKGDGFYTDGSFIQHEDINGYGSIPYIGSYGSVLLTGIPMVTGLLQESRWEISQEKLKILKDFIENSVIPYIYKGAMSDMMRGRAISRYNETDDSSGKIVLNTMIMVARVISNESEKGELYSFIKGMIELNTYSDHIESIKDLNYRQYPISIVNDINNLLNSDIKGQVNEKYHKFTPLQDRVVHSRNDYMFGISMFSNRIANFESMNGENKRGWYTGSGMTYLYNEDSNYYKDFWPTINPYRLPGTTVDTITMLDGKGSKSNLNNDFIGGVQLGDYGANSMEYGQIGPRGLIDSSIGIVDRLSLEAKKSWFMFDDEIVALGSGIKSTDGRTIETIVDNIKLKDDNSNIITINGEPKLFNKIQQNIILNPYPTSNKETLVSVDTVFVQGNKNETSIGYYFLKPAELNFRNVENIGTWQSIGSSGLMEKGNPKELKNNYLEIWIDHDINPTDESYEYVILPNKSNDELQKYSDSPKVEILSNTKKLQGVKHTGLDIISFNSFIDEVQTIEYLTVDKKASVMAKLEENTLKVAVSDPTMKNNDGIVVTIDKSKLPIENLIGLTLVYNSNVQVLKDNHDEITLLVDTSKKDGSTCEFEFAFEIKDIIIGKVENLKAINITKDDATLSWDEPKSTIGLVEYVVYKDGKQLMIIPSEVTNCNIENVRSNTIYGFKITAKYLNGEESKPKSINVRTKK